MVASGHRKCFRATHTTAGGQECCRLDCKCAEWQKAKLVALINRRSGQWWRSVPVSVSVAPAC